MRKYADGKRRDVQFQVGDLVLVKLQPYRQNLVAERVSQKLGARYFSPFSVLKLIGQVAYQIELSAHARIHDVFHVSLLKPYNGDHSIESMTLPPQIVHCHPVLEPLTILQEGSVSKHGSLVQQVLVHWSGLPISEITWEDLTYIKSEFPNFNLEDKVSFNGGSIDGIQATQEQAGE